MMSIPISSAAAAEKQIDQLQNLVNAVILAAVVLILADAAAKKDVSFLGISTETSNAYSLAAAAFAIATFMAAQAFARLADIIASAELDEAPRVLAAIFNHRWSFNPFSFFGGHPVAVIHAAFGLGLLLLIWWIAFTSLALVWARQDSSAGAWEYGLWYFYVASGICALAAIFFVQRTASNRLADLATRAGDTNLDQTKRALSRAFIAKCLVAVPLSAFGSWIYYAFTHIGA